MTLAQLRARVWGLLSENPDAPVYWTQTQVDRYLNDAYRQAARDTGALEESVTVTVTANTQTYEAPDTIKWPPLRVTYDGRRLVNCTKWELDRVRGDWENDEGYVSHYVTTLQNNKTFRLYKAPEATTSQYDFSAEYGVVIDAGSADTFSAELGTTIAWTEDGTAATFTSELGVIVDVDGGASGLVLYGKRIPPDMSADDDEPELPAWSHQGLAFAAASRALMKHGEQRDTELAAFYDALSKEYAVTLKGIVAARAPERNYAMSAGPARVERRPRPEDQTIVP